MLNKSKNIFIKRNCLSKEELISYAKQTLSEIEKHHIEKHLLDCELCSEALEGVRLFKDPSVLKNISTDMVRRLHEENLVSKKNNFRPAFFVAAAIASILIISGVFFTYIHNSENLKSELAVLPVESKKNIPSQPLLYKDYEMKNLNESASSLSEMETKMASPDKINSQPKDELNQVIIEKSAASINDKEIADVSPQPNDNGDMIADERRTEEISIAEQKSAPAQDNAKKEEFKKRVNDSEGAITYSDQAIVQKPETVAMSAVTLEKNKSGLAKANIDESLKAVQKEIENENYKSALKKLDELSKEYFENMNIRYLSGVVYYKTNEEKKALDCFNVVLNSGDKNLFEDARLHKALTYVKMSDNKNARTILNQIIVDKSRYEERAWEILEQIDGN